MSSRIEMTGQQYGKWVVLARDGRWAMCSCFCGVQRTVVAQTLRTGRSKSCGCDKPDAIARAKTRHGQGGGRSGRESSMYVLWKGMLNRCRPGAVARYPYHAGRGVKVCERWQTFENFLADMGQRPDGMTLDRYPDTNGDYEPNNVRWATSREQRANQRRPA